LDALSEYCGAWDLVVNVRKTEYMFARANSKGKAETLKVQWAQIAPPAAPERRV